MDDLDQIETESFLLWLTLPFSLLGFLALAAAGWANDFLDGRRI